MSTPTSPLRKPHCLSVEHKERRESSETCSMARKLSPSELLADEDYIDMDFSSASFSSSPPRPMEFEFQMSSKPEESQLMASPADELFYKGKLLPLHLPPRLHMVKQFLQDPTSLIQIEKGTPYMSCNASPVASCYVSGELDAEDYFHECSEELIRSHPKKLSWSHKLKFTAVGTKLKASRAFLKSLFSKPKTKKEDSSFMKVVEEEKSTHSKSFSSPTKSPSSSSICSNSSSSSSMNSKESLHGQSMLKRSSSVNSDADSSILGAIAYCKKSQQKKEAARKNTSDVGFCLLSVTKVVPNSEREKL